MAFAQSLEEWAKDKPLSILQLDPADRAVLRIADERDAIQKKTFTKWVNKHLTKDWRRAKCGKRVGDLFEDLRDGHNLVSLLEVLTGEHLPRDRGRMRFHMLQNVQTVLDFLRYSKIKLVNIRAEDIVDGNPKLTLGLIWTIILHFQISDIVVGMEENVSAKDALLKWAQKSTAKYPGVRVSDFTKSWSDGLAFNAIIHRNRPDLIDWQRIQRRNPRERLETAFSVAERDCGVTRLLDAEDVDTQQPDEKSLITYISSLYDAFPEPPRLHPLYDTDSQKKWEEYKETATSLYTWIRESLSIMQDRHFSTSLIEMRKMAADMNRFRVEEIPQRSHTKTRLQHLFRDVEKHFREGEIDRELHLENIERNWQILMMAHQEKDQAIHDEIKKLEKLQRVAEKIHRETKQVEIRLDDIEQKIEEEAKRIDRLHPLDAKNNCDRLERDMQLTEDSIKSMFNDTQMLRDSRFHQATELHRMVQHVHQRWINIRTLLHNRLLSVLASISFPIEEKSVTRMSKTVLETRLVETDSNFRNILEVTEWIKTKQKQMTDADFGSDLPSVQAELEKQVKEHRVIEKYQTTVDRCSAAKSAYRGDELQLYINYLSNVQKSYSDLLMSSKRRHSDLETLMDFVQSATNELIWLSEKEEREITRDWSSKSLNLMEVEQYYEALMSELEKREIQFNAVQDRGESLVLQHHPASKCIETYMSSMQTQWAWLLQLTLCLETHLKYVATYQQYFSRVRELEQNLARQEELLNSVFSKTEFSLDEGEVLLKDMQDMRDELTRLGDFVQSLTNQSREIIPLKQRKTNVSRPLNVTAICNYKQNNQQMVINKDERCILLDNSQRVRWRVTNSSGLEGLVPGVCFLIPPPDKEALDAVERIRKQYDHAVTLWQKKQLKMRQNMIFATIKVVKSWDLTQFLAMGSEQRNAIRKALNEDAEKLIQEGDANDPALRRLRREIDEVNRLFDSFEKQASDAEKSKSTSKVFSEQVHILQTDLEDVEHILNSRVNAVIPRDLDTLRRMEMEHKEIETRIQHYESRIQTIQRTYSSIPQKSSTLQAKLDKVIEKWERVYNLSNLYVERLKTVEVVISNIEVTTNYVSKFETKLSSYENLPTDDDGIKRVSNDLYNLQNTAQANQHVVEQLVEDTRNVRRVVEKSRGPQKRHPDVENLEDDVHRTTTRWNTATSQIVERIRSVNESSEIASRYNTSYQTEMNWLDTVDTKSKNITMMESSSRKRSYNPHMTLYNSVIEEKITIEQVNTMGARLAKEAKTYDSTLEEYRESVQELQPEMIKGNLVKKQKVETAAEIITNQLDLLNLKYQLLADTIYDRLKSASQEDPTFNFSAVPAPSPLRTYRAMSPDTEYPRDQDMVDTVIKSSKTTVLLNQTPAKKRSVTHLGNGDANGNTEPNGNGDYIHSPKSPGLQFSQIRSSKKIEPNRLEDGISAETAILVPLLIDPITGEKLTLAQAIGCGLIDIKTGHFVDPKTNARLTLQEAAELGYIIDAGILHKLLGVCGLVDPESGNEVTLLEAIRKGWYDLSKGHFINPRTGEPMTSEQAIRFGIQTQKKVRGPSYEELLSSADTSSSLPKPPLLVDLLREKGSEINYKTGYVENKPLIDAFTKGLFRIDIGVSKPLPGSFSLSDIIDQGLLVQDPSCPSEALFVKDRFSGQILKIPDAIDSGVLDPSVTEVFNPSTSNKVTVSEALRENLINPVTGKWDNSVPLHIARQKSLVNPPSSLKDLVDKGLVLSYSEGDLKHAKFIDPVTQEELTLLEAISAGNLDAHNNVIVDPDTEGLISLQEALVKGIATPEGLISNLTPEEATSKGELASLRRTSIFNVPCIHDPFKQEYVSIEEAVSHKILDPSTKSIKSHISDHIIPFDDAIQMELISPQIVPTLNKPTGLIDDSKELTVIDAIVKQKFLPSGEIWDNKSLSYLPIDQALADEVIDPETSDNLKGLFNINLTSVNVTKVVKHTITLTSEEITHEVKTTDSPLNRNSEFPVQHEKPLPVQGWPLREAIELGLFNPIQGLLTIPGTDRLVSFEECIRLNLIDPDSAAVVVRPYTSNSKEVSLVRALEKQILDSTGHYCDPKHENFQPIPMDKAISKRLVLLIPEESQLPDLVHSPMELDEFEMDSIQVTPTLTFNPMTVTVTNTETQEELPLFHAILQRKIEPRKVKLSDVSSGKEMNINEAIRKGFVDRKTGQVKVKTTNSTSLINFNDAVKLGTIVIVPDSTRCSPTPSLNRSHSSSSLSSVPEEASQPVLVSEEIIPIEYVITTTTVETTTSIITTKISRVPVDPRNLLDEGLIDQKTLLALTNEVDLEKFPDANLNLKEAIDAGEIDGNSGAILDPQTQEMLTINEALVRNLLNNDGRIVLPVVRNLSVPELKTQGLYDPLEQKVIHPESGIPLTIKEAIASDILNPYSPVKDPLTRRRFSLAEAIDQNIVSGETGNIGNIPLLKAIDSQTYENCSHPYEKTLPPAALTIPIAIQKGLIDFNAKTVINPTTQEKMSISEAIQQGKILAPMPTLGSLSLEEAHHKNLIDSKDQSFTNPKNGEKMSLSDAFQHGLINVSDFCEPKPDTSIKEQEEGNNKSFSVVTPVTFMKRSEQKEKSVKPFNSESPKALLYNPLTGKIYSEESQTTNDVDNQILIDPNIIAIDPETDKQTKLRDLVQKKDIDIGKTQIQHPSTGDKISFSEGLKLGLLATVGAPVLLGIGAVKALKSLKPDKANPPKLTQSPINTIDIKSSKKEAENQTPICQIEKVQAESDVIFSEYQKPYPLNVAIMLGKMNPSTGLLQLESSGDFVTLQEAIEKNEIDPNALLCRDPRNESVLTLNKAIECGLIDSTNGTFIEPISGAEVPMDKAMNEGLLLKPVRKISLPEVIFSNNYCDNTNKVRNFITGDIVSLKDAIQSNLVSVDSVVVKDPEDGKKYLPFKMAIDSGIVNIDNGNVKKSKNEVCNIKEAFDNSLFVEIKEPASLTEMLTKGLYNIDTKKFLNPRTGEEIDLQDALSMQIIDPNSVHVKDTREGFEKKMPLTEAIKLGFINGNEGNFNDFSNNIQVPLIEAIESGFIVDSRRPISLQKAIKLGLYSESSGKLLDPNTGSEIRVHEAIRRLVINPDLPCFWDDENNKILSLVETCRTGIIDRQKGLFHVPKTGEKLNLTSALEDGYILDLDQPWSLYDAIRIGLYDISSRKFIHPSSGMKLTLEEAVKKELISPETSTIKHIETSKLVNLNEGMIQGLIDAKDGLYINSKLKSTLRLDEAKQQGLILTPRRPLTLEEAVYKEHIYSRQIGKLADPLVLDWVTIDQAIKNNLIDPYSTAFRNLKTQHIKSLVSALEDCEIEARKGLVLDVKANKPLTFDQGFQKGILLTVDHPISFDQAVKRELIDLKRGTFFDPRTSLTTSLSNAVDWELIHPNSAVVRDPISQSLLPIRNALKSGLIDINRRALIDPQTKKLRPLCIIFEEGTVVFLRDPISFDSARDKGYLLLSGQFKDPATETSITLKEALDINAIFPNSALVKDVLNKKFIPLSQAFTQGLMDPDKSTVLNTETNHILPFNIAIDTGILLSPRSPIGVISALDYSLFNPTTRKFRNPYTPDSKTELSLGEGLSTGLLEPNTTVVKDPISGKVLPLSLAISEKIVDPVEGTVVSPSDDTLEQNLLEAWKRGIILPAEARLAIEEKYRTCTNSMDNLLDWLMEIERRLSMQEHIKETVEEVKKQLTIVKQIRDDVESHNQPIGICLDQVRQLVATGSEVLSVEEITTLERNGQELKTRYDCVSDQSETLYRKLTSAADELKKYKSEVSTFRTWMDKSFRILEDKERNINNLSLSGRDNTKEFVSDVIAHQGDLRFISMSAQKFVDESKDYLQTLNDFRTNLPSRLPYLEVKESSVRKEITEVTHTYQDLLSRANRLFDRLSNLGNKQKEFQDAFNKASAWIKDVTPRAQKILNEPVAGEPRLVEDQLNRAKSLQNEILSNGRLIDAVRQATNNLLNSLEELTPEERNSIEGAAKELESRYQDLVNAMGDKVKDLDSALLQSQDVQDAVDSVTNWLNQAESQLRLMMKPASLIRERLDEQIREVKLLQADIESHRDSIENMARSADKLISSGGGRVSKKVESKLQDVLSRYEKLVQKLVERAVLLNEVSASLNSFEYSATHFEQWFNEMYDVIENKLVGDNAPTMLESVMKRKQDKRPEFEEMISSGKTLVSRKDVTDTMPCKDRIKSLENLWKELDASLQEKHRLIKSRAEHLTAYEKLRDQVNIWLNNMERKVDSLQPVAVDVDKIKQQNDELKPIVKEYRDYSGTIDKLNDLGAAYDSILRGDRSDSPRRRLPSTPTKRTSSFRSSDHRSPSPSKTSPLSPSGSSGFGSRRSSQEGFHGLDDTSPVATQLNEINNRYSMIGMKLSDRQSELDSAREEVRKIGENLKALSQFLDKAEKQMPKDSVPHTRDEAEKLLRTLRNILEDLYDKQGLLDSTKTQLHDLLRRKPNAIGANELKDTFDDISKRWKSLQDKCKQRSGLVDNLKEFNDAYDNLNNWLNGKEKMIGVLGPIASDPRMVQQQLQQVQVMRDEFRAQKPALDSFNNTGDTILAQTDPNSPDGRKIEDKLSHINQKWNDLLQLLDDREGSLDAASGASADFYNNLNKLQDNLHKISDDLDDLASEKNKLDPEEMLKKLQALDKALESQRPVLADVQASGNHLCDILTDPTSKADIKQKLAQVDKLFNQCQKKLDNCKAELENSRKDAQEFDEACEAAQDWLQDLLSQLADKLLVSADRDILKRQMDDFEPIYRDVMNKEHEIIMTLNKGKELAASKSTRKNDQRTITQNIDKIQKSWDKLKKETTDRHTRLQTCKEHCRKYDKARDNFLKWLTQAEDKFEKFKLNSLKKADIDKQLKEINAFKNDVWRHSSEFDTVRSLGETFLSACDKDKQGVTRELQELKERWDALNNEILARAQELEDAAARLGEFNDNCRDVKNALNRCEDRLASADDTKDPKLLQKIKAIAEDAAKLQRPIENVKNQGDGLIRYATQHDCDSDHVKEAVDDLLDRYDVLRAKLDDKSAELDAAMRAMAEFNEQLKSIGADLGNLEDELNAMKPIGRDIPTVKIQIREIENFNEKLHDRRSDIDAAISTSEELIKQGLASNPKEMKGQLDSLKKQLDRLETKAKQRESELDKTLAKLEAFYDLFNNTNDEIDDLISQEKSFAKGVPGDVEGIRALQAQFKEFRTKYVESAGKQVDECNKTGQGLIQSAANGVSTVGIEKDLEKLNEKWNSLKTRLNEQERKLDVALLNSGKFQEALEGLNKWLNDIEDMVANQKPPSADYKVVKAQLQEQKFLNKMLLDRQPSVQSLFKMGKEIAANADPAERAHIEGQMQDLGERYENLCDGAKDRQKALEDAMQVAKDFQDKLGPLNDWLDKMGKKLKDMSLIPTDEDKIQRRIREHDALHDSILGKKPDFDDLADIGAALMELVGDEEASGVADKLQEVTDRYGNLVEESENLGNLLKQAKGALRHLVLSYEDLMRWMDDMNKRLGKYKVISVHKDKLLEQMDRLVDLTEEIKDHEKQVDETVESGLELMKNIPNDEAIQLKDKLDSLQRRFDELTQKAAEILKNAQEALPLVTQFHDCHNNLSDWMMDTEGILQGLENLSISAQEKEINRLEKEIPDQRKLLDSINLVGPQLCQLSPGEGASTIEGLVTRDNRRFDAIMEQIQRRAERINMAKQRSMEVLSDIDDLLDWFREIEGQIKDAEKPSCEPEVVRVQLQEHRALNDEITSQKARVREVLATAKKVLREATQGEDTATLREKADDLKETMESVAKLSSDRLNALEQALPLAEHFFDAHNILNQWMDGLEEEMAVLDSPALRPDQIMKLQDKTQAFLQSVSEHKPLLDKLNKTGAALMKLCNDDDSSKVEEIMHADNDRYNALRVHLREKQQALEKALQDTSQFKDKLDGMLNALESTADQVNNAEPISAHPEKIREQIDENNAIIDDVKKREDAFNAVKKQANDVINKTPNKNDPAVKEIKQKLDRLNSLWDQIQNATKNRGKNLDEALALAEKFWAELQAIMEKLDALQDTLKSQEPPAVEPKAIQKQQNELQNIKRDIEKVKPDVNHCRQSGQNLMKIVGDQDKPEIKKNIDDLDSAWDNITALFAKREENLIDAMEKAMEFHETLQALLKFLDKAEQRLANMGPIGTDIDAVKRQIKEVKDFKTDVDPMMVKVESLNRQAQQLADRTSPEQAAKIKGPLAEVNRRWDELLKGIVERQRELENALLRLGQFQHALNELMAWIEKTNKSLDQLKPVFGDPQVIEVELAKLKVVINDINAHQNSVDTLNDAGRQIIESEKGSDNASNTQRKLNELNNKWSDLQNKALDRQKELEDALREAQAFAAEIQDLLFWLNDVDGALSTSKPVGGLPETAAEQLARFMEIYNELEANRPKVEAVLQQGQEYLKKSSEGSATNLAHNLKTLRQRWESVLNRANDKKIKLEIALKEANEFHKAVQDFIDWLTEAERYLAGLEPVSRVLDKVVGQVESHKEFQKEVSSHREVMLTLEKKGNHLKYFSQKQDVILIKNLLISVQHRWDRVVGKSTERTRALDLGLKEAKEFHDSWSSLCKWLDEAEKNLDEMIATAGHSPAKIKQLLVKHKEFQRVLAAKQQIYDNTMRMGKTLKDKAPKPDEPILRQMLQELKNKWNSVCNKSVERQRNLEDALLKSGQFKDALQELLDWLRHIDGLLVEDGPVHGDLDTVMALIEQHKKIEEQVENRRAQMRSIVETAEEMMVTASPEEKNKLAGQIRDVKSSFDKIKAKCDHKSRRLEEALKDAEKLHKSVHMLLEWLSDAEARLRYAGALPDDEESTKKLLQEQESFMRELALKERDKDETLNLARTILAKAHPDAVNVIKHWISIIQSRWDEISSWAKQRQTKLQAHLASLRNMEELLEELMAWLRSREDELTRLEAEPLPDDFAVIQRLIKEHKEFMEDMAKRQPEIDSVCKPKAIGKQPLLKSKSPASRLRSQTPGGDSRETSPDLDFAQRRLSSPGRERTPDSFGHIGPRFDRRGSKAIEPQIKNPRVKALWDKWKHVWFMAWERQRRLQEKYNYLLELEKVKNFSWEDWRKRFLKFNNHKKSRVTDIFRKIDRNNNGIIPREEFIDAIIKTKFPTSRLEMNAVADMFDHGDHMIDYMEFIAALRPDWEEKKPETEGDIIDDEVQRQVMKCTCRQKFRVFQVGEGKYRFGDSQKLRLVRILRSTVMVRVGGGWVALDEFLVKNDPCRAKGRTNIELREQFILAEGVSQTMQAFKSRPTSASGSRAGSAVPTAGPITKVKEKSIRSVPMGRARSTDRTTPESTYSGAAGDDGFTLSRLPRKSSAGPARGSTPGSRTGSKPPSRSGSNVSLDSGDDGSRIPIRRSTSLKRGSAGGYGTPSSSRTPFGSSSSSRPAFSLNTNVISGRGPGERAHSFTRPPSTPKSGMKRTGSASSVHSLPPNTGSAARPSRIPVFVGGGDASGDGIYPYSPRSRTPSTSNNSRTPSNSNIPVAIASSTPIRNRTPSGTNVSFSVDSSSGTKE